MKTRLNDLNEEKLKEVFLNNKELCYKYDEWNLECQIDECREKLERFTCLNWCLNGYREPDYVRLKDDRNAMLLRFIYELKEYDGIYGLSTKTENYLANCQKMDGSNLFAFMVKKLVEMFYQDEIKPCMDFGQQFVDESNWPEHADNIDCFLSNCDIMFDDETEEVFEESIHYLR